MKPGLLAVLSLFAFTTSNALAHDEREGFGKVLFRTSCTPQAQKEFERALAQLHSFDFPDTLKSFAAIQQTDPGCAISYWGLAVATRPNPLVGPWDAATLKRGLDAAEKGEGIGAKTQRERDWLAAIKEFYKDFDKVDQDTRTRNYEKAMEALTKKYPGDVEAKVFHALALNEIFDHKDMAPLLKAIAILEPLDRKYPDHPGITHYLIHSYDFAPLARKGVPVANKYAKIAPSASHAQHMPSHIYSMVGMWQESIASNLRSVAVASEYAAKAKLDGVLVGVPHSYDFMQYAWLHNSQGNREEALKFMRGAADLEDSSEKHVAMENRLYPMREQLGDMLRGYGEPAAALKEYELSMKNAPNRLRGYYGAAKAAQDSGQAKKAGAYYKQLARLTRDADGDRPEIVELKQYLASAK